MGVKRIETKQGGKGAAIPGRLAATLALDEPVDRVSAVSPARSQALATLGIFTLRDLLTHFPHRYLDMSHVSTIAKAPVAERCTIVGSVYEFQVKRPKPHLTLTEITLVDETGTLMITCFRQPWLVDRLAAGMCLAVSGKLEFNYGFKRMTNPFFEVVDPEETSLQGLIVPVHPACEKLTSAWMRRLIANGLAASLGVLDPLPLELRLRYRLPSRQVALRCIHFPQRSEEIALARRRLVYEEVLLLELFLMSDARKRCAGQPATSHVIRGPHGAALARALPFTLTDEQAAATSDLLRVMAAPRAANHMILGDVGTGKTVVAAAGLAAVADSSTQAFMMAPTEVLAQQYASSLGPLLDQADVTWELLVGSTPPRQREAILARAKAATIDVLFGTHALLEDEVCLPACSLVVIDEQQRFGVDQRAKLIAKGCAPDVLYLTATPIPRTLALALYGDMTLSYIRQRPKNQKGNATRVLARTECGIAYDAARAALAAGHQVYVVCPLVGQVADEKNRSAGSFSDASDEEAYDYAFITIEDDADMPVENLKAARDEAQFLQAKTFSEYRVDLLHGKMSGDDKRETMQRFRNGEIDVLVATTVIEVGLDVPNATVMIIEDADRFGLAQLHQLRGRVGRGCASGEVYLISATKTPAATERLSVMEKTDDGFAVAEYDLSLRREGDILGNRQHGASALKLVNVVRDGKAIEAAHADAAALLEADPQLKDPAHRALGREMRLLFSEENERKGR
ncbi:MAG: ATP-dependent DNA helicase RecG [Eggerthellaceae bacterium]